MMRGQGRIFLRGSTYWCGYYVDGKEQRESCKTTDLKQAEKHLKGCLRKKAAHEDDPSKPFLTARERKRSIADLMDALKVNFELRGKLSPQNKSNINKVKEDFGSMRALALTAEAVASYVRDRLAEGYKKATVNRWTETLRAAFALAELPAPKIVKLDESDNVRRGFFSEPEIRAVMSSLPADLGDFVLFAWLTGMRKGEIASLRWEDLNGDLLSLRGENAKNGNPRSLPCEGELAELIARRRQRRTVKIRGTAVISDLIFHRRCRPIKEFRKSWAKACTLAKVPGRLFHDLRRSAVRDLVRSGVSRHVAMSISGHRSEGMFRRYDITDERDQRQALRDVQEYRRVTAETAAAAASKQATETIQ